MNQEQPPKVEKKEELTLESVREYFEDEKNKIYSEEGRKKIKESTLKLKLAERWKEIAGYEKVEGEKKKKIPGLLEKFERKDYEDCLEYIEKVLSMEKSILCGNTHILDLVNHKEYGEGVPGDRNIDIETEGHQKEKNRLRKFADVLTGEIYKKKKKELLNKALSGEELDEIFYHIESETGTKKNLPQIKDEYKRRENCRELLEVSDEQTYRAGLGLERLEKEKASREKIKEKKEELFKWRRYRHFFLKEFNL